MIFPKSCTQKQLDTLITNHITGSAILSITPRVGKSRFAMSLARKFESKSILILTNSVVTNANWLSLIQTYNVDLESSITIECYQSLHKLYDVYDLVILDEAELVLTHKRLEHVLSLKPKHWLILSGTLSIDNIALIRSLINLPQIVSISLRDAVRMGLLPEPSLNLIPIEISNSKLIYYKGKAKHKQTIRCSYSERFLYMKGSKYNLEIECTEKEYLSMIEDTLAYYKESGLPNHIKVQLLKVEGLRRKNLFYDIKKKHLSSWISKMGKRLVIFTTSIKEATRLARELKGESIHSQKLIGTDIDKFNSGEIDVLVSINVLSRGVDLLNIESLFIPQIEISNQQSTIQKADRSLLSNEPNIYVMYIPNTVDDKAITQFSKRYDKVNTMM